MNYNSPISLIIFSLLFLSFCAEGKVIFYVSPKGNDAWSGKLSQPNKTHTDGPFATLSRARDAIRELKEKQGGLKQPVIVFLRGGLYFLPEPFVLGPEDSGTKECPILYTAYKDEKPIISGGKLISNWKRGKINGREIWVAEIPQVKEGKWFFRELWAGERRLQRARHPDKGYLQVAKPPTNQNWMQADDFFFQEGDIIEDIALLKDAEVVAMALWSESHLPIAGVEKENNRITFAKKIVFPPQVGDPYYVENALPYLDSPGEWCLQRENGKLYYLPAKGEEPNKVRIFAPRLSQLVRLEGKCEEGKFVEYVIFRGLTFSHCEWWFSEEEEVGGFAQAAWGVPGAIFAIGARNCSFEKCTIKNIGTYGLELSRGCKNNRVVDCEFSDLGAGGVKIGEPNIRRDENEQTGNNRLTNCHIFSGGRIFHSAVGVWVGQSYGNILSHNHIHDFYYSGFSIGWTWGYGETLAHDNIIEGNEVHHIGRLSNGDGPILSDMGGIYTLGIQPGTIIRFNLFHDIAGLRYGGWGIYFDEGSTHILAEKNIVYNTTHGGFHQHYGKENIVRNNIFALGQYAQIQRTRPEEHTSFFFQHNIVYWKEGELLVGNMGDFHFLFDNNIYWKEGGGAIYFAGLTFEEWKEKGMDRNSLIADPLFQDIKRFDFRLKDNSPALKVGFVPFELPFQKRK